MNLSWLFPVLLTVAAYTTAIAVDVTNHTPHPPLTAETNVPPMNIVITNNVVTFNGKVIGNVNGTNFVAVPDVAGLSASHDTGFALGVRYGAVASRRNPDVQEWNALITIAKSLMPK